MELTWPSRSNPRSGDGVVPRKMTAIQSGLASRTTATRLTGGLGLTRPNAASLASSTVANDGVSGPIPGSGSSQSAGSPGTSDDSTSLRSAAGSDAMRGSKPSGVDRSRPVPSYVGSQNPSWPAFQYTSIASLASARVPCERGERGGWRGVSRSNRSRGTLGGCPLRRAAGARVGTRANLEGVRVERDRRGGPIVSHRARRETGTDRARARPTARLGAEDATGKTRRRSRRGEERRGAAVRARAAGRDASDRGGPRERRHRRQRLHRRAERHVASARGVLVGQLFTTIVY